MGCWYQIIFFVVPGPSYWKLEDMTHGPKVKPCLFSFWTAIWCDLSPVMSMTLYRTVGGGWGGLSWVHGQTVKLPWQQRPPFISLLPRPLLHQNSTFQHPSLDYVKPYPLPSFCLHLSSSLLFISGFCAQSGKDHIYQLSESGSLELREAEQHKIIIHRHEITKPPGDT